MKRKVLIVSLCLVVVILSTFFLISCNDKTDLGGYVLSDKGTYLAYKKHAEGDKIPNLTLLYEQDDALKNTYSMIAVDGAKFESVTINEKGADAFIRWMSLASTRAAIADFGKDKYDEALFYLLANAQTYNGEIDSLKIADGDIERIRISTTTSVNDTGLLGYLETLFEEATGWNIEVSSAGTGAAISAAKDGNADLLLVHSASQERAFIDGGFARTVSGLTGEVTDSEYSARISFMYNYFVLLGSSKDPAGVKDCATIVDAFTSIANGGYNFISRGDTSGTHTAETNIWKKTTLTLVDIDLSYTSKGESKTGTSVAPQGSVSGVSATWYISAGQGMGACLTMASEYKTIG